MKAPAEGGVGSVKFVGRTTSWSNLYIDGELLNEFRGEREFLAELPTGIREVVVRDFQDKNEWAHGRLFVYAGFEVELQFDQASPPTAINREEAWMTTQ